MQVQQSDIHFYGNVRRKARVGEFRLTETAYPGRLRIPSHTHQDAYFCLVLKGRYLEFYDGRRRFCFPSTVVFHPGGESHSNQFSDQGGICFNFQIGRDCLERIRDHATVLQSPIDFHGGVMSQLAGKLYQEFRALDTFSHLAIESVLLEMAVAASRSAEVPLGPHPPRWLSRVKEILHFHVSEKLSLATIADTVQVHPVHLARSFHTHFGCTVGQYLRQLRIESSSRQLASSDTPIVEIAAANGFSSQSHFSTTFKKVTGMTPAKYRSVFARAKSKQNV